MGRPTLAVDSPDTRRSDAKDLAGSWLLSPLLARASTVVLSHLLMQHLPFVMTQEISVLNHQM